MSEFLLLPKLGFAFIACTIHLVTGFFGANNHRLSYECPPVKPGRAALMSAGRHTLWLMGFPGPAKSGSSKLRPSTTEPSRHVDLPEYEYVELPPRAYTEPRVLNPEEPDQPSPFALFLVDKQFKIFEEKMNEEFKFAEDNLPKETPPVWHIYNYKAYMMQAYCALRTTYIVRGGMKTGDDYCDHLILPKPGTTGSAFIVNYVLSKSDKDLRKDAKQCLQTMLDQRFGLELKDRQPPLDEVYKVGISFCGPKAAVEFSTEVPASEFESTTKRKKQV